LRATALKGLNTVTAFCETGRFHHDTVISLDGWPDGMPIPDMALHLRCSKCGGWQIMMMIKVTELSAKAHESGCKR
jgi:hypothetical protein